MEKYILIINNKSLSLEFEYIGLMEDKIQFDIIDR